VEADAALRTIVRRDSGESYRAMLTRMAQESGIEAPTEDLARFDRKRQGKTLSNADWKSPTDPDARIAKMKGGTTHLAYKPEHVVDLDSGVVVAAPIHPTNEGHATTLSPTLDAAARNLDAVGLASSEDAPRVVGYHACEPIEGPGRRRVEDAHRRTRAQSGLRQSPAAEIGYRARDHAPARRNGQAVIRSYRQSPRHAPRLAARTGEPPQALPDRCRRVQSRRPDARPLRSRNAEGGRGNPKRPDHLRTEMALIFALIAAVDGELAAIVIVAADPTRN
jgi:hypothetical protein